MAYRTVYASLLIIKDEQSHKYRKIASFIDSLSKVNE